ncbi:hypothetical protein JW796_02595 [Candidatus Dojkabacteria bacterium]|nr:hypothetical protein [Candidatus Dojkabacteria bacterium]
MKKHRAIKKLLENDWTWVVIIFIVTMMGYIFLVQVWKNTSSLYPPANSLDHEIRLPENRGDWLVRRENGVCPFDAGKFNLKDPFAGFRNC